jgi:hypothetical protein
MGGVLVTAKAAEVTPGSAARAALVKRLFDRPGGRPAAHHIRGGFYGWSIKHNVQETAGAGLARTA